MAENKRLKPAKGSGVHHPPPAVALAFGREIPGATSSIAFPIYLLVNSKYLCRPWRNLL